MIRISSRAFRDMGRGPRSGIIDVDGFFFLLRVQYVWFALVSCGGRCSAQSFIYYLSRKELGGIVTWLQNYISTAILLEVFFL